MRLKCVLAGACASVVVAGLVAATAVAAPHGAYTCTGGDLSGPTYSNVFVTGQCTVPNGANVVIRGNLMIAPGATFDAQTHSTVDIRGNVIAGHGSQFGLGCTAAHPCDGDQTEEDGFSTNDSVGGNVILNGVYDAAINGDVIHGNLVSNGGGAGLLDPEKQFVPFSVKDDEIKGNVIVNGLQTVWFGIIRTKVGGNVVLNGIQLSDPDGNEIVADTIGGNLVCHGMNPAPQLGDAINDPNVPPGYGPSQIGGNAVGQCAALPSTG